MVNTSNTQPIASFRGVRKAFGANLVLDGIDLDIAPSCCTFVAGPSGTGKSVLVKHIVGLLDPDEGQVFYRDLEVNALNESERLDLRKKCSYVFQHPTLFDSISVLENVSLVIRHRFGMKKDEADARAMDQLSDLGIVSLADQSPTGLSSSEKKKVSVARSLALNPETLILDEPTTGLDPYAALEVDELTRSLAEKGKTVIVISHDLKSIRKVADEVVFLLRGRVRLKASAPEFLASTDPAVHQFVNGLIEGEI